MPLIKNFRATTPWKAFILNALVSSIVIVLALYIKGALDSYHVEDDNVDNNLNDKVKHRTSFKSVGITFAVTFVASLGAYFLMHFTFGFGGGMLVSS